jgi:hypothetical protein
MVSSGWASWIWLALAGLGDSGLGETAVPGEEADEG